MERKKRIGDRSDGYRIKTLSPMSRVAPHIMKVRADSQNLIKSSARADAIRAYIHEKRRAGLKNFGMPHVFVAAYVRTISQRPAINRFISGQKIFARNNVLGIMTVKTEMTLEAPDTEIKMEFPRDATAEQVYNIFNSHASSAKNPSSEESGFEKTARVLNYIPSIMLSATVSVLRVMDYFGLIPKSLLAVSPFHGSFVITSMGSLGIPPIYHHLYDFGNCPVFISYGGYRNANELEPDGTCVRRKYVDFAITTDERICDGFYFASALKVLKTYLENPYLLDKPPDEVVYDID